MNTAPVLTFFNNKGGVGKTSLVYHLSWMFSSLNKRVIVADLDPQANLTAAFLDDDKIEALWNSSLPGATIYQCVKPLTSVGDITEPRLQEISPNLHLIPGDVSLSGYEDSLSKEWPNAMGDNNIYRPMRILSAFWQVMQKAAKQIDAYIILVDIGPNLGAINRSVLLATDYVTIPLGADLFSLQGLKNLGPTLRSWQSLWQKRLENWRGNSESAEHPQFTLPKGEARAIGYLCQQHSVRLDKPVKAYDKWVRRIPGVFRESVLGGEPDGKTQELTNDEYCLGTIKHYRSLVPMAQEHRKPIFHLTPADGAIGSHANAVSDAKKDFNNLARSIAEKMGLSIS